MIWFSYQLSLYLFFFFKPRLHASNYHNHNQWGKNTSPLLLPPIKSHAFFSMRLCISFLVQAIEFRAGRSFPKENSTLIRFFWVHFSIQSWLGRKIYHLQVTYIYIYRWYEEYWFSYMVCLCTQLRTIYYGVLVRSVKCHVSNSICTSITHDNPNHLLRFLQYNDILSLPFICKTHNKKILYHLSYVYSINSLVVPKTQLQIVLFQLFDWL